MFLEPSRQSILNFRIGFLSSIGGRLPYPCLPTPFPILRHSSSGASRGSGLSGTSVWRRQSRYTMSRTECRIKFLQNQWCRSKIALHPPKSRCRTFLRTPPVALSCLTRSRQGARGGGVSRRAGGGYRGTFGFRKRIALQGGVAATVTPVALLCATKVPVAGLRVLG